MADMSDSADSVPAEFEEISLYPLKQGETLTQHDWVEMQHVKLLGSGWRAAMNRVPAAGYFGFILWMESMRQDPAGTLPDDDDQLAMLAGFGRDVEGWRAMRADGALYGWGPCLVEDDARDVPRRRLSHRTVEEIACRGVGRLRKRQAGQSDGTRRVRVSRLRKHFGALHVSRALHDDEAFCDHVLAWLDGRSLSASRVNVEACLMDLNNGEATKVIEFKGK